MVKKKQYTYIIVISLFIINFVEYNSTDVVCTNHS